MAPPAAGQKASKAKNEGLKDLLLQCWGDYTTETPGRLKLIDSYLVFVLLTGVVQFVYCALVGTFPFNSFLAGFISCIASFVLAVALRMQVNKENSSEFANIAPERAFADFLFAHIILHLVVMNFIG